MKMVDAPPRPSDEELYETYVYLIARALVARQEIADLAEDGVDYNVVKRNAVGAADFVNPNLDVAYLEAWVAVDEDVPVALTVPEVHGRYYTAQLVDEWGDVIANVNERTFPHAPHGEFVLHAPGAAPPLAEGQVAIALHSRKAKLLARVEIADDLDGAIALQRAFALRADGAPRVAPPPPVPPFDNERLLGAELFELADALLDAAPEPVPALLPMRDRVMRVADRLAAVPGAREELDARIAADVVPRLRAEATGGVLPVRNGWLIANAGGRYGDRYHVRAAQNLVGIWANDAREVVYYVGTRDAHGEPYRGGVPYALTFPADELPAGEAGAYWSVILVDVPDYRVVPNAVDRYNLNDRSGLVHEPDGSLRLDVAPAPLADRPAANWLPSPAAGAFSLTLRLYVPTERALAGDWCPPPLAPLVA